MYSRFPQAMLHQCGGQPQWLPVAAAYEVVGHVTAISHPCPACGRRLAQPICPTGRVTAPVRITRTPPPSWLPVLKAVVSAECPACGLVLDISDTIANDPEFSAKERAAAERFSTEVAVIGGVALAVIGLSWLVSRLRLA